MIRMFTKKLTDIWAKYTVLDIDSSDKALELNLQIGGYSMLWIIVHFRDGMVRQL